MLVVYFPVLLSLFLALLYFPKCNIWFFLNFIGDISLLTRHFFKIMIWSECTTESKPINQPMLPFVLCNTSILMLRVLVMGEVNVSFIETVILSVPDDLRTLEHIQPLWSALEEQVSQQRVYSLGISDLSKVQLEELYDWASVRFAVFYSYG